MRSITEDVEVTIEACRSGMQGTGNLAGERFVMGVPAGLSGIDEEKDHPFFSKSTCGTGCVPTKTPQAKATCA